LKIIRKEGATADHEVYSAVLEPVIMSTQF